MRFDGFDFHILPVDKELPYSLWTDAIDGTFNPFELTGGEEYSPYHFFNNDGSYIFRDLLLDRILSLAAITCFIIGMMTCTISIWP